MARALSRTAWGCCKRARQSESMYAQLVNMMSIIATQSRLCDGSIENTTEGRLQCNASLQGLLTLQNLCLPNLPLHFAKIWEIKIGPIWFNSYKTVMNILYELSCLSSRSKPQIPFCAQQYSEMNHLSYQRLYCTAASCQQPPLVI